MPKESDQRYTPERILDVVREFGGGQIGLDPCSTPDNRTRAKVFRDESQNGLAEGVGELWSDLCSPSDVVFVNCPYSRGELLKWVHRCMREAGNDLQIVALLPSDLGSKAGALAAATADALCFVRGRIAFDSPDGQLATGAKHPSVLVYWGDRAKAFRRVFSRIGIVWTR